MFRVRVQGLGFGLVFALFSKLEFTIDGTGEIAVRVPS